ncbi:hypothetical protein GCM10027190_17910 [Spirosoma areae]
MAKNNWKVDNFTYGLNRKLKANNLDTIATAVHPGWTKTNLQRISGFFVN